MNKNLLLEVLTRLKWGPHKAQALKGKGANEHKTNICIWQIGNGEICDVRIWRNWQTRKTKDLVK